MGVYYNDSDAFVCAWLRNLIAAKLLPAGDVDERPIEQVTPDEVRGYTQAHFFAGIGGWPYALQLAGWDDRPVWTGSCPCQPFSVAGNGAAGDDARHLWPCWFRLIRECRPERIFGEQVANGAGLGWLDVVSTDLEAEAYTVGAVVLGAHSIGAPHVRPRLWFAAHAERQGRERPISNDGVSRATEAPHAEPRDTFAVAWRALDGDYAGLCPRDGLQLQVERDTIRGYGNAIVPQVAAAFVSAYMECAP